MRIFWVTAVLCTLAAALAGTRNYQPAASTDISDELLAYEISIDKSVTVNIPADVDLALLTVWLIIPPQQTHSVEDSFSASLNAEQRTTAGQRLTVRGYALDTRATVLHSTPGTADQAEPGTPLRTIHRLADGQDWICDPRTIEVDLSALVETGGQLRVKMADGPYNYALLRLSYRFLRSGAERQLLEAGMSRDQAQDLIQGSSALGFSDLPEPARVWALSSWGRRLTAVGRTGTDYSRRRLLLGPRHTGLQRDAPTPDTFTVSPGLDAAINVTGQVHLELEGPPDAIVSIEQPGQPRRRVVLDHTGIARPDLPGGMLRTLVLSSDTPLTLRASLPQSEGLAQFGDIKRILRHDTRVALVPDYRTQTYYQLHPTLPLRFRRAPNEGAFRLRVRAKLPSMQATSAPPINSPGQMLPVEVRAELRDRQGGVRRLPLHLTLQPSSFESFSDMSRATDPATAHLFSPDDTESIALYGPTHVAVSAMVTEPGIADAVPDPAYATLLPAHLRLKNIPYMSARWASIRPSQVETLRATGRQLSLRTQVRIVENDVGSNTPLPEQAIYPRGYPPRRTVLVQNSNLQSNQTAIQNWFPISSSQRVQFPAAGQTPGRLRLRYHAPPTALGQELSIELDHAIVHRQTLRLTSGIIALQAVPGPHQIQVRGLAGSSTDMSSTIEVDEPPPGSSIGYRRYSYNELSAKRPLTYRIAKRPGTVAHVIFLIATEGPGRSIQLHYTIDDGHPAHKDAVFVQSATSPEGALVPAEETPGEPKTNARWDTYQATGNGLAFATANLNKVRLRLGDDLKNAFHKVTLTLPPGLTSQRRMWIRAVLIGQPIRKRIRKHKLYLGDVP